MKPKTLFSALLLFLVSNHTLILPSFFDSLDVLQDYAKKYPEFPEADNINWLDPDYTTFYQQFIPSSWEKYTYRLLKALSLEALLRSLDFGIQPFWDTNKFKNLITSLTQERIQKSFTDNHIVKLLAQSDSKFVVWGDLQGSFHSLVRDLNKLNELNIIDNQLNIQANYCFVFNGDAVSRSPYNVGTLTIIMKLLEKNPDHVFYIKGNHETNGHWKNYGLARELKYMAGHISEGFIPLAKEIDAFFNTLPLGVFIKTKYNNNEPTYIQISHLTSANNTLLDPANYAQFLLQDTSKPISRFQIQPNKKSNEHVDISALIKAQSYSTTYEPYNGLKLLEPEKGATTWTILSSPNKSFKKLFNFHYDAFCMVYTNNIINEATITLYKQDVEVLQGFSEEKVMILTGQPYEQAKKQPQLKHINPQRPTPDHGDEIVIGMPTDLTRADSLITAEMIRGVSLKLNTTNREKGGVHNKRLRLIILDDEYTPHITLERMHEFLDIYKTNLILASSGTATLKAALPLIQDKKLLVLFNWSGANIFRQPELNHIIHYRTSYKNEAIALVNYAINELNAKRFAIFYENNSFGKEPLAGAKEELKKHNITDFIEVSYPPNTTDVSQAAQKIQNFNPDAILFFSSYGPSTELIRTIGVLNLSNTILMSLSVLPNIFRNFLNSHGLNLLISRIVPMPSQENSMPIVQEYIKNSKKYSPGSLFSSTGLEGYINASLLVDVLNTIEGMVTKEKIIQKFESIKNYNFKGLELNFDPQTHELSKNKDIWIDAKTKWIYMPALPTP